jgi:tetratricopeptide (TPR) repeat protein
VRSKLGEVLASQDRYDESIEEYKAILNRDPENAEILNNLGVIYFRKKTYEEALRYLLRAVEIDPDIGYIHNNLGMVYAEMGMHEKARDEYEKAIASSERKSSSQ